MSKPHLTRQGVRSLDYLGARRPDCPHPPHMIELRRHLASQATPAQPAAQQAPSYACGKCGRDLGPEAPSDFVLNPALGHLHHPPEEKR